MTPRKGDGDGRSKVPAYAPLLFMHLQTCYKFFAEKSLFLQTTSGLQGRMLKDTESEKHQFFRRIVLILQKQCRCSPSAC